GRVWSTSPSAANARRCRSASVRMPTRRSPAARVWTSGRRCRTAASSNRQRCIGVTGGGVDVGTYGDVGERAVQTTGAPTRSHSHTSRHPSPGVASEPVTTHRVPPDVPYQSRLAMKFFIDTADLDEIREAADMGVLDGVTTNPSLAMKAGATDFEGHILKICEIVDGDVSAEV